MFALMSYDDGLREWYPAETWDRPSAGKFSWAQLELADGNRVLVWDQLPDDEDLVVNGTPVVDSGESGAMHYDQQLDPTEVSTR